jgi:hypothetical protein
LLASETNKFDLMKSEQIHELTVAEIGRLVGEYYRQRRERTEQLAALFSAAEAGQPEERPRTDRAEEARSRALQMLNGFAPADLKHAPPISRKQELEIEVEAIDIVLSALSQKELVARAAEAAEFALEHGAEWEALCRDIILTATRLGALERQAIEWRQKLGPAVPATLPMARFIGTGRSIVGALWASDPLYRPREAALQEKIVTAKEIKAAENG